MVVRIGIPNLCKDVPSPWHQKGDLLGTPQETYREGNEWHTRLWGIALLAALRMEATEY